MESVQKVSKGEKEKAFFTLYEMAAYYDSATSNLREHLDWHKSQEQSAKLSLKAEPNTNPQAIIRHALSLKLGSPMSGQAKLCWQSSLPAQCRHDKQWAAEAFNGFWRTVMSSQVQHTIIKLDAVNRQTDLLGGGGGGGGAATIATCDGWTSETVGSCPTVTVHFLND